MGQLGITQATASTAPQTRAETIMQITTGRNRLRYFLSLKTSATQFPSMLMLERSTDR